MGLSLSCVRRLQAALANVLIVFSLLLTYAQGIEQSTKRHRSGAFFYRRHEGDVDLERGLRPPPTRPPQELKPVIHSSRDGDENAPLERVKEAAKAKAAGDKVVAETMEPVAPSRAAPSPEKPARHPNPLKPDEPRRFHLSRSSTPVSSVVRGGNVSKRSRYSPAVFIERSERNKRNKVSGKALEKHLPGTGTAPVTPDLSTAAGKDRAPRETRTTAMGTNRVPKRPLSSKRNASGADTAVPLPKSMLQRWDVDLEQLTRDMNEYTLQQIGLDLANQAKKPAPSATRPLKLAPSRPSSFKPKAPPPKKAPEQKSESVISSIPPAPAEDIEMEGDDTEGEESDEDYVVETYIRMPGNTMEDAIPPGKVGLLVLDTEPDVEFFYGDDSDGEDEWAEDDEDENAENYYTADYPEDEVASDDEYDRDVYHYRTRNASDLEEYGDGLGDEYVGYESEGDSWEKRLKIAETLP